ncbi:hypothetical protein QYM36_012079 [Artemia franciscana]|uniref:Aminoacyl-tRNA synthetase class II (D/K/N) domain-containing protein n=1 Tax=Artemia franciscana TaxID=6661 RepID=A0AA88L7D1_ARTSF|nr:hypothetical protein QYM36_012079 [Artemia franciscana]
MSVGLETKDIIERLKRLRRQQCLKELKNLLPSVYSPMASIHGTYTIWLKGPDGPNEVIDFKPPFLRIRVYPELEKRLQMKLPHPSTLDTPEAVAVLDRISTKHNVRCPPLRTAARFLDKLVGHFLEEEITSPTFIIDYPLVMSPLAKCHRTQPGLTERFKLFVGKKEICNGCTEQNDPFELRKRFVQQVKDRAAGDDEAHIVYEDFCTAMEYGLPPTGGCGMGIDRIAMFLTNSTNIQDIMLLPAMKNMLKRTANCMGEYRADI